MFEQKWSQDGCVLDKVNNSGCSSLFSLQKDFYKPNNRIYGSS